MAWVWRLIVDGPSDAAWNMAVDEALLITAQDTDTPCLRFYQWQPAAVSLGFFQKVDRQIDVKACQAQRVDWVRRPTGGRAVLHDDEVTYSIVTCETNGRIPRGVLDSYKVLSEALADGLRSLGVRAHMIALGEKRHNTPPGAPEGGMEPPRQELGSAACFDAPSWYELVVDGKKLVGSAQMRRQGVMLQHGSIPLSIDSDQLFSLLAFPSEDVRLRSKRIFDTKAISLTDVLGYAVQHDVVEAELVRGFERTLGIRFERTRLTRTENTVANRLYHYKYKTAMWNENREAPHKV